MKEFLLSSAQNLIPGFLAGAAVWLKVRAKQEKQHLKQMRYLRTIHMLMTNGGESLGSPAGSGTSEPRSISGSVGSGSGS